MLSSLLRRIFLFSLCSQNLRPHAPSKVATENAALLLNAIVYRGSSDLGHRYGVQLRRYQCLTTTIRLTEYSHKAGYGAGIDYSQ